MHRAWGMELVAKSQRPEVRGRKSEFRIADFEDYDDLQGLNDFNGFRIEAMRHALKDMV